MPKTLSTLDIAEAWLWYDALSTLGPKKVLKTDRERPKYVFFREWEWSLLDALTDGRPLLVNFHVAATFKVGSETKPGAIIYKNLFKSEGGKKRIRAGMAVRRVAQKRVPTHEIVERRGFGT